MSATETKVRAALRLIGNLEAENRRLLDALEDVRVPMRALQRHAEGNDTKLNGMAYSIANNLAFVQEIARKALEQ